MDKKFILSKVDHTLLAQGAVWNEIKQLCDDAIKYSCASVCIPPFFVKEAKSYTKDKLAICTVIGFPNGYNTTAAKVFEGEDAIRNGADELDMVLNIGQLKDKNYDFVRNEIKALKKVCGDKILKVIIEACLLTDDEKVMMSKIISEANANYIKTSTGFSTGGAKREDIVIFSNNIAKGVKMKAAGGIRNFDDAMDFINLGCERLGTSALVKIMKKNNTL